MLERSKNAASRKNVFYIFVMSIPMAHAQDIQKFEAEVAAIENAFAKTMVDRDLDAFKSYLAPDTTFWANNAPLRVAAAWQGFFQGADTPFS
jgi:hypothetical protein